MEQKACGRTGQVKAAEVKLTQSQLAMFGEQGYVVVDDVLEPSRDIDPILAEYDAVLSSVVDDLEKMGAVFETYDDLPFLDRLIALSVASKWSLLVGTSARRCPRLHSSPMSRCTRALVSSTC